MLEAPAMDELILLPEEQAVRRYLDAWNLKVLHYFMLCFGVVAGLAALVFLALQQLPAMVLPVANLVVIRLLYVTSERPFFQRNLRHIAIAYVLLQYLALLSFNLQLSPRIVAWEYLIPLAVLGFRFQAAEHLLLGGAFWLGTLGRYLWVSLAAPSMAVRPTSFVGFSAVVLVSLVLAISWTRRMRRSFLADWHREVSRHRERTRMRQELDYARRIQLSMLPRADPEIDGLDLASVSLPANEVGGDYFDYLRLPDGRLVIVVGDVAGHGVPAGLLISGVRSCLYLLRDSLPSPVEVMDRLNRMVKATSDKRLFITLLYMIVDRPGSRLVLSAAGHQPPLHYTREAGEVGEIQLPALPLGCLHSAQYQQQGRALAVGDVLLLYTDGLIEQHDRRGEQYGDERLVRRLAHLAPSRSAREIRDGIMADLWNFKGDAEQVDDITLVVLRVR